MTTPNPRKNNISPPRRQAAKNSEKIEWVKTLRLKIFNFLFFGALCDLAVQTGLFFVFLGGLASWR